MTIQSNHVRELMSQGGPSKRCVIGIDPGKKGGIAFLDNEYPEYNFTTVMPMAGQELDMDEVRSIIDNCEPRVVVIEKVASMPKQGVSSTFTFGKGYGQVLGICAAFRIPIELVLPQRWKNNVLAGTKKDKDASIAYVRRVFPSLQIINERCREPHDGMTDALCIAEYGRRKFLV